MQTEMIRIFDEAFRYIGICDDYSYLNYKKCFSEAGSFVMRVVFTQENYALYSSCAYLCCPDGQCFAADALYSDGEEITVKGRDVLALFDRAVLSEAQMLTGRPEEILCTLAASGAAVLPLPLVTETEGAGETVTYDALPGSLYGVLRAVTAAFGWGMRMCYDFSSGALVFSPYAEVDRTAAQREREPLILGRARENLAEEYYAADRSDYRNGAVVGGENAAGEAVTVTVEAPEGEPPRYLYYSAKSLRAKLYATEEEFLAALRRVGENALALYGPRLTYTAVLNPHGNEAVSPGDRATIGALWSAEVFDAVITSVETVYDRGDRQQRLVAGAILPTMTEVLGRKNI